MRSIATTNNDSLSSFIAGVSSETLVILPNCFDASMSWVNGDSSFLPRGVNDDMADPCLRFGAAQKNIQYCSDPVESAAWLSVLLFWGRR